MFVESCSGEESNESLVPKVVKEVGGFYFVLVFCVCVFVLDSEYPRVFYDPVRELLWRPDVSDESARMEKKKKGTYCALSIVRVQTKILCCSSVLF